MNLREKTLVILGLTFIGAFILMLALSLTFYTGTFLDLERQQADKDAGRALYVFDSELTVMEGVVGDWGWWDDTYRFSQDLNPEYITDNLGESTFTNLRLNYFVIIGLNGTVLFAQGYDLRSDQYIDVPKYFLAAQTQGFPLNGFSENDRKVSGIFSGPEGLVLVASAPILTSAVEGPSTGFLVMGRKVDDAELTKLSKMSGVTILANLSGPQTGAGVGVFAPGPLRLQSIQVDQTDPSLLTTVATIGDSENNPAIRIGIQTPRDAYQNAFAFIRNYFMIFTIMMAVFAGIVILIIDRMVLARLSTLVGRVQEGSRLPEGRRLPPMEGNDEFSHLFKVIAESQQRIYDSEAKFRRIVETAQEGIWVMDEEFRTTYVNEQMAKMAGYTVKEFLDLPASEMLKFDSSADLPDHMKNRKQGITETYEKKILRRDGSSLFVTISATPIYENQRFVGSFAMVTDITDRKRAETALNLATKKLNMLARTALTDLNNQLFTLQGYIELSANLAPDGNLKEYIQKQREAAGKIQNQIAYIRHFQDMGVQPPKWQSVTSVFLYAISHLDLSRVKRTINLNALEVYADPLLEKVLFSLVENSLSHGKTVTEICCHAIGNGEDVVIVYEDNGAGVPAPMKEAIFRHHYASKGLPLSLVREILSVTDMTIRETGEPGKGARFEIRVKKGFFRYTA